MITGTIHLRRSPSGLTSNIPSTRHTERTEQRIHMCHTQCFQPSPALLADEGSRGIHRHIVHSSYRINKHTYKGASCWTGASPACTPQLLLLGEQPNTINSVLQPRLSLSRDLKNQNKPASIKCWKLNDLLIIQTQAASLLSGQITHGLGTGPFLGCFCLARQVRESAGVNQRGNTAPWRTLAITKMHVCPNKPLLAAQRWGCRQTWC